MALRLEMCRLPASERTPESNTNNNTPLFPFDKLIFDRRQVKCSPPRRLYGRPSSFVSFGKLIRINVTKDSIRIMTTKKEKVLVAVNLPAIKCRLKRALCE